MTDGIAQMRFDNPPLQVMTPQTMNELNLLPRLSEDDVRAIVFTGNPESGLFIRHFSVEELDDDVRGANAGWNRSMDDVLRDLENLPKPVIAAIEGSAMPGAFLPTPTPSPRSWIAITRRLPWTKRPRGSPCWRLRPNRSRPATIPF